MGEFWERWEVEEPLTRGISIVRELWELWESFFMCLESSGMCLESSWRLNPSYFACMEGSGRLNLSYFTCLGGSDFNGPKPT